MLGFIFLQDKPCRIQWFHHSHLAELIPLLTSNLIRNHKQHSDTLRIASFYLDITYLTSGIIIIVSKESRAELGILIILESFPLECEIILILRQSLCQFGSQRHHNRLFLRHTNLHLRNLHFQFVDCMIIIVALVFIATLDESHSHQAQDIEICFLHDLLHFNYSSSGKMSLPFSSRIGPCSALYLVYASASFTIAASASSSS